MGTGGRSIGGTGIGRGGSSTGGRRCGLSRSGGLPGGFGFPGCPPISASSLSAPFPGSLGPSRFLNQCSDEPQQGLMLGAMPAVHEEVPDLNVCRLTTGRRVGLVLNEYPL